VWSPDERRLAVAWPWMPSRIPARDALVAFVPKGAKDFVPPRPVYEQRWFEENDRCRVVIPYDGGPFDTSTFRLESDAWDHVTCDNCNVRIPALTLCFVTKDRAFHALCQACYETMVVRMLPWWRRAWWYAKQYCGVAAAA
jgi:hypothetical protein